MTSLEAATSVDLTILVVCTGNICRSPLAEQLLGDRLRTAGVRATVSSAGTMAMVGSSMTDEAAALSRRFGGDPSQHVARDLTPAMVESADLVLTATRQHRSAVVSMVPRAHRYSCTLTQFARFIAEVPSDSADEDNPVPLQSLLAEVAYARQTAAPVTPESDDIEDPYRRSADVYDRVGQVVDSAVHHIVAGLGHPLARHDSVE